MMLPRRWLAPSLPLLDSADPVISGKALEAAAAARDAQDRDLLLAVMRHINSGDQHARQIAQQELNKFPAQYSAYQSPVKAHTSASLGGK